MRLSVLPPTMAAVALHAFVDESRRGSQYILAAVLVAPRDLDRARSALRQLAKPGQRRVHFQSERDARRREILTRVIKLDLAAWAYVTKGRSDRVARAQCLTVAACQMARLGVTRLVLESCQHQDAHDRALLARLVLPQSMAYEHLRPHEEPLPWASDAVAWCVGAGNDWRRRLAGLLESVIDVPASG